MKFEFLHKGQVVESKDLGEGNHKFGRSSSSDIQLKSTQISKQHGLIVVKGNKAAIVDMGSSNGIFVNGILVRKQRIQPGDDIAVGDFRIRIVNEFAKDKPAASSKKSSRPPVADGNLARDMNYQEQAAEVPEVITPQERLLLLMDQRVMKPFYGLMKTVDWRMLLFSIISLTLVSAVFLSVIPIVRWGRAITTKEALSRAHTVVGQTVRENYRIISKTGDFTRLTVEAAEAEQGMLSAIIVDPRSNAVLAPVKLLNKPITDIYTLIALKKITEEKEETVSVEKESGVYVLAQPIYLFSQEQNDRALQAVVVTEFEVPTKIYSTFEPLVEAALFAMLCSFAAYFFIFKMFTYPIIKIQEQLDAALKGDNVSVTCEAKCAELETLATVINFSVSRIKQGGGGAQPIAVADGEAEDNAYIRSVEKFDEATSDGILLLDTDKKVILVGKVLEDMLAMRSQYAKGQNISDACRDQSFAGTAIDLAERVISALGESQTANLDINGTARSVGAVAHKNSGGELKFILIVVKMGGA